MTLTRGTTTRLTVSIHTSTCLRNDSEHCPLYGTERTNSDLGLSSTGESKCDNGRTRGDPIVRKLSGKIRIQPIDESSKLKIAQELFKVQSSPPRRGAVFRWLAPTGKLCASRGHKHKARFENHWVPEAARESVVQLASKRTRRFCLLERGGSTCLPGGTRRSDRLSSQR
jgi:hypothetical protein